MAKSFGRLSRWEHRTARREGNRYANDLLVVYARRSDRVGPRVGFSVGKQFGRAVRRNRLRRRVREACQWQRQALPAGVDLVVIPRAPAASATVPELAAALHALMGVVTGRDRTIGRGGG